MIRKICKFKDGHPIDDDFYNNIHNGELIKVNQDNFIQYNQYDTVVNKGNMCILVRADSVEVVEADEEDDLSVIGFKKIGNRWFNTIDL